MTDRLLKRQEVEQMLGFKRSALYDHIGKGTLPKPVKIGNASRWRLSDVQTYIKEAGE